ncbi:MAG TPA: hypothetical protein VFP70_08645 [Burkholderiales bacterium]|nr:hypothetical protein [Burkholderiales bacterium]
MADAARLAGQVLAFLLFALAIGAFSQWPPLRPAGEGEALVRLAMTVPGRLKGECRRLTDQELARLAPNMRRPLDCPRERLPVRIRLEVDGILLREEVIQPSGFARDGAANAYWTLQVPAGRHVLRALVSDDAGDRARALEREGTLELKPGAVVTVDFDRERGGILFR